ncbi:hypothetical protein [Paraburkholderia sp. J10-1]|uniref:hypothetical protein n=1 Tax=Paraburkholderia sp. J10-1 TaxID=2805430 RepID=UPI002AB753E7|nr:hypothetical protein [Paraburkholderia sp. J10-1]
MDIGLYVMVGAAVVLALVVSIYSRKITRRRALRDYGVADWAQVKKIKTVERKTPLGRLMTALNIIFFISYFIFWKIYGVDQLYSIVPGGLICLFATLLLKGKIKRQREEIKARLNLSS